jgi:hypothetical protein
MNKNTWFLSALFLLICYCLVEASKPLYIFSYDISGSMKIKEEGKKSQKSRLGQMQFDEMNELICNLIQGLDKETGNTKFTAKYWVNNQDKIVTYWFGSEIYSGSDIERSFSNRFSIPITNILIPRDVNILNQVNSDIKNYELFIGKEIIKSFCSSKGKNDEFIQILISDFDGDISSELKITTTAAEIYKAYWELDRDSLTLIKKEILFDKLLDNGITIRIEKLKVRSIYMQKIYDNLTSYLTKNGITNESEINSIIGYSLEDIPKSINWLWVLVSVILFVIAGFFIINKIMTIKEIDDFRNSSNGNDNNDMDNSDKKKLVISIQNVETGAIKDCTFAKDNISIPLDGIGCQNVKIRYENGILKLIDNDNEINISLPNDNIKIATYNLNILQKGE